MPTPNAPRVVPALEEPGQRRRMPKQKTGRPLGSHLRFREAEVRRLVSAIRSAAGNPPLVFVELVLPDSTRFVISMVDTGEAADALRRWREAS